MKTVIVVLALSLFICGCNGNPKPAASKQSGNGCADSGSCRLLPRRNLQQYSRCRRNSFPSETVDIYPKVTGFMDMIRVDRGSRVHKGELIIRLSAPELVRPARAGRIRFARG